MEKDVIKRKCEMLIMAGSAGSLEVFMEMLPEIRTDLGFPLVIVMHRSSLSDDASFVELLSARTGMPVKEIEDKEIALPGCLYVAPKNYHLLCESDRSFSLDASEKVNFSRPSIDVAFESAAEIYENALWVMLLSGANNDGTDGIRQVKAHGGTAIVQAPSSARAAYMPEHAIAHAEVDHVLMPSEMRLLINSADQ